MNKQKKDYIKANRKAAREAEIEMYGRPLPRKKVHKSKKVYDRKKFKASRKDLPFFYLN
jgi:hypothetical protein